MNRGTVIITGNFELPDKNAAAHRGVNNGKLLRSLGYDAVFLGTNREEPSFSGIKKREYGAGFDMYEQAYPRSARQWAAEIFDMTNLRTLTGNYPDTVAIMLYNTQYATVRAVRKAFVCKGIRVLYDCTEWSTYTEGSFLKHIIKSEDSRLIEQKLPRQCVGIIAVSSMMEQKYGGRKPLIVLPPLVDTEDPIWKQEREKRDRFTFCYAGSPSDKDRLDLLLEAFSVLPDGAVLRIIGITKEEFILHTPGAAAFADHAGITFTGRLTHYETVREILSCDCFVFLREPTRRNNAGFPTKFAEAFTCGVPVITTSVSDVSLYADDKCVILPDVSPAGICEAMQNVMVKNYSPAALRDAFDYKKHTDGMRRWLERVLCKKD